MPSCINSNCGCHAQTSVECPEKFSLFCKRENGKHLPRNKQYERRLERVLQSERLVAKIIWAFAWENKHFTYAKTKTQISCAVTAQPSIAFVFATRIALFLFYLYPKFQASSFMLWLYSLVCVGHGGKPKLLVFSCTGSYNNTALLY